MLNRSESAAKYPAEHNPLWQQIAMTSKTDLHSISKGLGLTVQAKPTISNPSDPFEKEADDIAHQVMRMPEPMTEDRSQ